MGYFLLPYSEFKPIPTACIIMRLDVLYIHKDEEGSERLNT
jgi:hypothetical protein